jgi:hypothetical protein
MNLSKGFVQGLNERAGADTPDFAALTPVAEKSDISPLLL